MSEDERRHRHEGLKSIVTARNPGDWVDEQLEDIRRKEATVKRHS
jgi:trehalose 6-phosphate synthase